MSKKLYTAAEIAKMRLPGLPTTKPPILARAEKEKWYFETKIGLGGVRKMFELPAYYQPGYKPYADEPESIRKYTVPADVHKPYANESETIRKYTVPAAVTAEEMSVNLGKGIKVDPVILAKVLSTLNKWLTEKDLTLPPDKYAEMIAVLYDYIVKGADSDDLERFLRVAA
ncbi:MAG: hypothetical protein Q7R66_18805 [Undibacterium sp.]|uniref:hypothetical protein n=1 Tax=Undibacterium sp. TaxID=1914977 RepID=UPI002720F163|nr:hypothetical protein [Undibacterium sp.]MDO8654226.1 hypothetical protein [Undibacterium sp.]